MTQDDLKLYSFNQPKLTTYVKYYHIYVLCVFAINSSVILKPFFPYIDFHSFYMAAFCFLTNYHHSDELSACF